MVYESQLYSSMVVRGLEAQVRGDESVLCCLEGSDSARHDPSSRATTSMPGYLYFFFGCYDIASNTIMA